MRSGTWICAAALAAACAPAFGQDAAAFEQDGKAKLAKKDYDGAVGALSSALKKDPNRYSAYVLRGHARNGKRDHEAAMSDYLKALQQSAGAQRAAVRKGLLGAAGHRPARIAALTALILFDLSDWDAYRARAALRVAAKDYRAARADYDKLTAGAGATLTDRLARAECLLHLGDRKGALAECDGAVAAAKGKPVEARALTVRGDLKRQTGDVPAARRDYDRAIQLAPRLADAYLGRGMARTKDLEGSVQDLTKAIELGASKGLHERGITHMFQGKWKAALADFSAYLAKAPGAAPTLVERARVHLALKDAAAARLDVDKALKLLPAKRHPALRVSALMARARIRVATRDARNAAKDLNAAIRLAPRMAAPRLQRAQLRLQLRDVAGAVGDATSAAQLQPRLAQAWAIRAEGRFLLGNAQGALQDWSHAFKIAGGRVQPSWVIERGRTWRALGQLKRALADFDLAVSSPGRSDPWFHRGLTRLLAGDRNGGAQDLALSVQKRRNVVALVWLGALGQVTEPLRKLAAQRNDWSASLAKFVTHAATPQSLLAAAQQSPQHVRMERLAQAYLMVGLRLESRGDKAGASKSYQAALATRATHTVAWQWLTDRVRILQLLRRARARQGGGTPQPGGGPRTPTPPKKDPKEPY